MNEPAALKLPDETWLEIPGQQGLDYQDLKCACRVCKRLNKLVKDTSLEGLLFRAAPTTLKKGTSVEIHPLLEQTMMTYIDSRDAIVLGERTDTEYNAHKLRSAKDFATSPSTRCLIIKMAKGLKLEKETGVTVRDVLKAVGKMWKEPYAGGYSGYATGSSTFTWRDALGDHNGWTGWQEAKVKKEGEVTLNHNYFDS